MLKAVEQRMTDFAHLLKLEPGVDDLLHVSQISRDHVDKPSDVLSYGQVITAKVVDIFLVCIKDKLGRKDKGCHC